MWPPVHCLWAPVPLRLGPFVLPGWGRQVARVGKGSTSGPCAWKQEQGVCRPPRTGLSNYGRVKGREPHASTPDPDPSHPDRSPRPASDRAHHSPVVAGPQPHSHLSQVLRDGPPGTPPPRALGVYVRRGREDGPVAGALSTWDVNFPTTTATRSCRRERF